MTQVTLQGIHDQLVHVAQLVENFNVNQTTAGMFPTSTSMPTLKEGEKWVGLIVSADGKKSEHIILLPGDNDRATWAQQMEWAASIGGFLPDRLEQAMLYKFMKDEFQEAAYWSSETHSDEAGWAWFQVFNSGGQLYGGKGYERRARAVRRELVI